MAGIITKQRPVAYLTQEGEDGFRGRIQAREKHKGKRFSNNFLLITGPFDIRKDSDTDALIEYILEELGPGTVLIVDTLSQAAPGMDENSGKDYGLIASQAKKIVAGIEGFVCFIAHTGKDETKGMRGHSSLFAAMDTVLEVSADKEGIRTLEVKKSKDGKSGTRRAFTLEEIRVGVDEDLEPITSCYIVPAIAGAKVKSSEELTPKELQALSALQFVADTSTGAELKTWLESYHQVRKGEGIQPASVERNFRDTKKKLIEKGRVLEREGRYFIQP